MEKGYTNKMAVEEIRILGWILDDIKGLFIEYCTVERLKNIV